MRCCVVTWWLSGAGMYMGMCWDVHAHGADKYMRMCSCRIGRCLSSDVRVCWGCIQPYKLSRAVQGCIVTMRDATCPDAEVSSWMSADMHTKVTFDLDAVLGNNTSWLCVHHAVLLLASGVQAGSHGAVLCAAVLPQGPSAALSPLFQMYCSELLCSTAITILP